jgi:radical SAM superfamily enzyme YgiQ (UPF0313 family)
MRLVLINPKVPESFWSFRWAVNAVLPGKRALNPPLGLATLAALTPPHWQVEIFDENIEPAPERPDADIVGIGGMGVQAPRQKELIAHYRALGYHVVVGGSAASLCPEIYDGVADTVVSGEAEYIWPRFCSDFEAGAAAALYRETGTVDLADSPTPRFDLLKLRYYANATLQYSRGCPFTCEFCDIIVMFGRKPRTKSTAQIGRELEALRREGARRVFFVDDNMIGNKKKAKELLAFIADYQAVNRRPFVFGTEVSINLAQDEDLMAMMRVAGFSWVFIGIESPDAGSLKETGKTQNLREDLLVSVRRLYARGIEVLAGFIIGFDNDTPETFERQYGFITESGIQTAMIGLLTALPKTPLYERLARAGRLRPVDDDSDNTRLRTNVVHTTMNDETITRLYADVYRRLLTDRGIATRIRNKLKHFGRTDYRGGYSFGETVVLLRRFVARGLLPGGPRRLWYFVRSFPLKRPSLAPLMIADWITGLSMRAFARDHLWNAMPDLTLLNSVRVAIERYLPRGEVWVTCQTAVPDFKIRLGGALERRFFRAAAPQLRRLLQQSRTRLTLALDGMPAEYRRQLEKLLKRLSRYGDRVCLELSEATRQQLMLDLTGFRLVLVPAGRELVAPTDALRAGQAMPRDTV